MLEVDGNRTKVASLIRFDQPTSVYRAGEGPNQIPWSLSRGYHGSRFWAIAKMSAYTHRGISYADVYRCNDCVALVARLQLGGVQCRP